MYRDFPFNKGSLLRLFELPRTASTISDVYGFEDKIINLIFFPFSRQPTSLCITKRHFLQPGKKTFLSYYFKNISQDTQNIIRKDLFQQ